MYEWIPDFGTARYITCGHEFKNIGLDYEEWVFAKEMMRRLAVDLFDPQFDMAAGATVNLTLGVYKFAQEYDKKYEKFNGKIPHGINQIMLAFSSQMKLQACKFSERCFYEMANLMGGAGVCDNTLMHDLIGISRIQEVVGGTRQIQQYILSRAIRQIYKML